MRLILTGGGTAGHINPALAIAATVKEKEPDSQILFIGAVGGMEERLVPEAGYTLKTFRLSGMVRSVSPAATWANALAVLRLLKARIALRKIMKEFRPDAVVGTGGFVSYPAMKQASAMGIPTYIHESNVKPGRANIRLAPHMTAVMVPSPDSVAHFPRNSNCVVTGNPLRVDVLPTEKSEGKAALGISRPLVYSAWGSLGAGIMNEVTAGLIALEAKKHPNYIHVHSTGNRDYDRVCALIREKGVDLAAAPDIDLRPYVSNAPQIMAAADLLLCRAGAMSVSEVAATGTPAIIVPSPHVADDHQRHNARSLSDRGAAVYLEEADATPEVLYDKINDLLADPDALARMREQALKAAVYDACERIYALLKKA